jgi:hypothetical protein
LSAPPAAPRNIQKVMQNLKSLAAANGQRYYYSWPVKNRRLGTTQIVEGPSIKLANDLAQVYGNCITGVVDVQDNGDQMLFTAMFADRETGSIMFRPFQQRVGQDMGMSDTERAENIVFQVGASKAIRNVVVNALQYYANFTMIEAKKNLVQKVEQNRAKADQFIDDVMAQHNIDARRIEAIIGRSRKDWLVQDVAHVIGQLQLIRDNMASADDIFPSGEAVEIVGARQSASRTAEVRKDEPKETPKPQPKANGGKGKASAKPSSKPSEKAAAPAEPTSEPEPAPQPAAQPADDDDAVTGGDVEPAQVDPEPESKPQGRPTNEPKQPDPVPQEPEATPAAEAPMQQGADVSDDEFSFE